MKKPTILQKDSPKLREVAKEVLHKDITSKKIRKVVERMRLALQAESDGVAIAAPQIGESLRIFVIAGRTQELLNRKRGAHGEEELDATTYPDQVYINPMISKLSRKKKKMEEGCLSVRWLYGEVERSEKATIEAYDESGKKFVRGASGLMAQIFQHEVDHLNGILFIDKAENVEDIPPEKHE
ncbi:peptide deformylase [Candidatus Parcubacteria bacterium]|nr:peptide deformylase [Candidatus Parcubacteria bacterium]